MGLFQGQRALVTGGTSGIGRAAARALAAEGCHVTVTGLTAAEVEACAAEESALAAVALDVTDGDAVVRLVAGFDRLDIVRPGLLTGQRGNDRRTGERFGILVSPLVNPFLRGRLHRFRAIPAATVAAAIVALAGRDGRGRCVHFNRDLESLTGA